MANKDQLLGLLLTALAALVLASLAWALRRRYRGTRWASLLTVALILAVLIGGLLLAYLTGDT